MKFSSIWFALLCLTFRLSVVLCGLLPDGERNIGGYWRNSHGSVWTVLKSAEVTIASPALHIPRTRKGGTTSMTSLRGRINLGFRMLPGAIHRDGQRTVRSDGKGQSELRVGDRSETVVVNAGRASAEAEATTWNMRRLIFCR